MELWEKLEEIDGAIKSALKDCTFEPSINGIIVGSKALVGNAQPPSIWVFQEPSSIDQANGIAEEWTMNVITAATYLAQDPDEGKQMSEKLALQASSALTSDRTLNNTVRIVERTGFRSGLPRVEGNDAIYGAGVELQIKFRYLDR